MREVGRRGVLCCEFQGLFFFFLFLLVPSVQGEGLFTLRDALGEAKEGRS